MLNVNFIFQNISQVLAARASRNWVQEQVNSASTYLNTISKIFWFHSDDPLRPTPPQRPADPIQVVASLVCLETFAEWCEEQQQ